MSFYNTTALIIEDSAVIGLMLSQYLKNIGFSEVFNAQTGKSGIRTFNELLDLKKTLLVFLDFDLPECLLQKLHLNYFQKLPK